MTGFFRIKGAEEKAVQPGKIQKLQADEEIP